MIDRNGLPPSTGQAQLHTVRVENCDVGETKQVRILSATYGGIGTHFVKAPGQRKGSSKYCRGEDCRADWHRLEWFYRGYFAAELFDAGRSLWLPCVWELTEQSELDVREQYARGQVWEFSRLADKDRPHPPTTARLLGRYDDNQLPAAWDYRCVLMRMYHLAAIDLTTKNPMPPRLHLAPSPFTPGFQKIGKPLETVEEKVLTRMQQPLPNGKHK